MDALPSGKLLAPLLSRMAITAALLIQHQAFGPRYKPPGHLFDLCESGRLLIISLGLPPKTTLSREICTSMNSLAEEICFASSLTVS